MERTSAGYVKQDFKKETQGSFVNWLTRSVDKASEKISKSFMLQSITAFIVLTGWVPIGVLYSYVMGAPAP